jgi:hypothetical protein
MVFFTQKTAELLQNSPFYELKGAVECFAYYILEKTKGS